MPSDGLEMPGGFVLFAQGVVDVDVDDFRRSCSLGFGQEPSHLMGTHGSSRVGGMPGADAQKIGHVRCIRCFHELPLKGCQGLGVFASQKRVGHVENMTTLRLTELYA
jgi:hypothetical protein